MANNLYDAIPQQLPAELAQVLLEHKSLRIERIVSQGHASEPGFWYDQDEHEWVLLVQGEASIEFDSGEVVSLVQGGYLLIPAHTKHRVKSTSLQQKTIWLAIFYC
ncbi:MAG: cupin domain-containing protein [Gammaproteobacteria bacterium]|nr:cupin domain-containing protein [Gammaproteobacteria bacterium]